jgi:peptidoglycan/xylan/chitin deacetylase (PgdA/CDA1 family)
MLHRFHDQVRSIEGHNPDALRRGLAYLRREHYDLIRLEEVFRRLASGGAGLARAIAFTMDDGYADQAEIAGPVFAEFDCPVTTFVSTGFLDRQIWFWWDRVEYIFRRTGRKQLRVVLGPRRLTYNWSDLTDRARVQMDFTARCKEVPEPEKEAAIGELAAEAGVEVPKRAPPEYAPMSWDDARACEKRGMTFGPHTVTHPVLARTSSDQTRREIIDSWMRLHEEVQQAVPVFCYPNGRWQDFSAREIRELRALGLAGAVVGEPGYADVASFRRDADAAFKVKRFIYPESLADTVQYVSGLERLKQVLRREA